jgi:hypothetical protein
MNLEFSRRLALLGIIPPIADTIRRWHQLGDIKIWPFWLDDFFLGGFLLYGAWLTQKDVKNGRRFLTAAWGFACGMAYISFFDQITSLDKPDPAPISSVWVAVIKGVFFLIAILGLTGSLWGSPRESGRN